MMPVHNAEQNSHVGPQPTSQDPVLLALDDLVRAAEQIRQAAELMTRRAEQIRAWRDQDLAYRDIVQQADRPLIAELLTATISQFEAAGTRFRQAQALALHREGLTMEQIGDLFGLTRQRISTLLRTASSPSSDSSATRT